MTGAAAGARRLFLATAATLSLALVSACETVGDGANGTDNRLPAVSKETSPELRSLAGRWFGEFRPKNSGYRQWVIQRETDGTYNVTFRIFGADCRLQKIHQEAGLWAQSPITYFTQTIRVNRAAGSPRDQYLQTATPSTGLRKNTFEYSHIGYPNSFRQRRIDASFEFPHCPL